jgi:hypothetical protein
MIRLLHSFDSAGFGDPNLTDPKPSVSRPTVVVIVDCAMLTVPFARIATVSPLPFATFSRIRRRTHNIAQPLDSFNSSQFNFRLNPRHIWLSILQPFWHLFSLASPPPSSSPFTFTGSSFVFGCPHSLRIGEPLPCSTHRFKSWTLFN